MQRAGQERNPFGRGFNAMPAVQAHRID
jgi:hypothetical protein